MIDPVLRAIALFIGALLLGGMSFRVRNPALRLAMRIVAAWLLAIASLAATIPLVIKTPGYTKDHME